MRHLGPPANANTPAILTQWAGLPFAFWSLGMEMAMQNWRLYATLQGAALEALGRSAGEAPAAALVAADLRETGEAMLRAQLDVLESTRRAS